MESRQTYYSILNVGRPASSSEIRQSYYKLALQFHPDRNPATAEKFKEISEAYGVLSDTTKRYKYDCSLDINQFFKNPFDQKIFPSTSDTMDMDIDNEPFFKSGIFKDPPIEKDIYVSLEEINTGTVKKLKITRQIILSNGISRSDDKILAIHVMPGWKAGTKVTFSNEGDQKPGSSPADVVITIKDKEHKEFTRDSQNNLIYNCKLSLKDALISESIDVPTLDGRTLRIKHDHIIRPGTETIIGEGLPLPNLPNKRANLIVKYDIIFPQHLSSQQKQVIYESLPKY